MPIYEYVASRDTTCDHCRRRFHVRQAMNDEPLGKCPKCGADVRRLFSRPFISVLEPLPLPETMATHTEEEAGKLGLTGGFAEDHISE